MTGLSEVMAQCEMSIYNAKSKGGVATEEGFIRTKVGIGSHVMRSLLGRAASAC